MWAPIPTGTQPSSTGPADEIMASCMSGFSLFLTTHKDHWLHLLVGTPPREKERFIPILRSIFCCTLKTDAICERIEEINTSLGKTTNTEKCRRVVGLFIEHPIILINVMTRVCSEDTLIKFIQSCVEDPRTSKDFEQGATETFALQYNLWQEGKKCAFCGNHRAAKRCGSCFVQYCDRDCQKAHWKTHKKTCGAVMATGHRDEDELAELLRQVRLEDETEEEQATATTAEAPSSTASEKEDK